MNVFFVLSFALYVPTLICSKNLFLSLGSNPGYCRIEVRCWPLSCTTFFSLVHPIPSFLDCSLSKLKEPSSSFWWLSFRESANNVTTFFGVKSNSIGINASLEETSILAHLFLSFTQVLQSLGKITKTKYRSKTIQYII